MELVLLLLFVGMVSMLLSGQRLSTPSLWLDPVSKHDWRLTFMLMIILAALLFIAFTT